jgi:hypothetical protein
VHAGGRSRGGRRRAEEQGPGRGGSGSRGEEQGEGGGAGPGRRAGGQGRSSPASRAVLAGRKRIRPGPFLNFFFLKWLLFF